MPMRDDTEALRAKNEALLRENQNLRRKMEEERKPKKKFSFLKFFASIWSSICMAWEFILRTGAAFGWLKIGGTVAVPVAIALVVSCCQNGSAAWDRYMETQRTAEAAEIAAAEAAGLAAHQSALGQMRLHTPVGVSSRLWIWCLDHCAREHMVGGAVYSEGMITGIQGNDYLSDILSVEGPWLTQLHGDYGSRYSMNIILGTNTRLGHDAVLASGSLDPRIGWLAAITRRYGFSTTIRVITGDETEYMREHAAP